MPSAGSSKANKKKVKKEVLCKIENAEASTIVENTNNIEPVSEVESSASEVESASDANNQEYINEGSDIFHHIIDINTKYDGKTVEELYEMFSQLLNNTKLNKADYIKCNDIMIFTLYKAYEEIKYTSEVAERINSRHDSNKANKSITYKPCDKICEMCEVNYNVNTNRATIACILYERGSREENIHRFLCNACTLQKLNQGTLKYISYAVSYYAKYILPHILATLARRKIHNAQNVQYVQNNQQAVASTSTEVNIPNITYNPTPEDQYINSLNENYTYKGYSKGYLKGKPAYPKGVFKGDGKSNVWHIEHVNTDYSGKGYSYPVKGKGYDQ